MARARCVVAEAEIALAARDLGWTPKVLDGGARDARSSWRRGQRRPCAPLAVRRLLLIGHLDEAERSLTALDPAPLPPALAAAHGSSWPASRCGGFTRQAARAALARARRAAQRSRHPSLMAEVDSAARLARCAGGAADGARHRTDAAAREVEALLASNRLVVDACRHAVRDVATVVSLASRPVLFALARTLGEAWPNDVSREALWRGPSVQNMPTNRIAPGCGWKSDDCAAVLRPLADVRASKHGFLLYPKQRSGSWCSPRPVEEEHAAVLALARRRRILVEFSPRAGAGRQPAHGAARARRARGGRQRCSHSAMAGRAAG